MDRTLEMNQCIFPTTICDFFRFTQCSMSCGKCSCMEYAVCETKAESWEFNRNLVSCSKAIARWIVSHFCGFTLHAYEHNSLECIILFDCILNVQTLCIKSKFWSNSLRPYISIAFECFAPLSLCRRHSEICSSTPSLLLLLFCFFVILSFISNSFWRKEKRSKTLLSAFMLDAKVLSLKCKTKYSKWMQQQQQRHFDGQEYLMWICQ